MLRQNDISFCEELHEKTNIRYLYSSEQGNRISANDGEEMQGVLTGLSPSLHYKKHMVHASGVNGNDQYSCTRTQIGMNPHHSDRDHS